MERSFTIILLFIFAAISSAIGNLMLKKATLQMSGSPITQLLISTWFWGGILAFIINFIFFTLLLDKMALNIAYPVLTGIGFLTVTFGAWWFFGETLSAKQYTGMAIIMVGIFLLAQETT